MAISNSVAEKTGSSSFQDQVPKLELGNQQIKWGEFIA